MPIAPAANQQQGAPNLLQDVVWPCGRGWVQNRWGRCVPIRPYGYYGPRHYYGPRYYRPHYYYGPRHYYGPRYYRPHRYYHRW
ncbi:hypothetical protein ACMDCR_06585 [Labrys okinawensis]|uniref:hypothetical protein n=1 Tax=Labrys okinawensis TaxID=346911 RepID=UPI0039BD302E